MPLAPAIRPIAIRVIRRDEHILVFERRDPAKPETFYRPLRGGIDFGETGRPAVAREMREELAALPACVPNADRSWRWAPSFGRVA